MRTIYPIYGLQGKMDLPWKITKSGKIAVDIEGWSYCNPKTGWVPMPGTPRFQTYALQEPHYANPQPNDGPGRLALLLPRVGNRKIN